TRLLDQRLNINRTHVGPGHERSQISTQAAELMTQRTDPPAQVSETVGAVFECQRTNNILNDGRSPAKRIKECRPGSQLLRHVGGNQTPADFNLFAQM